MGPRRRHEWRIHVVLRQKSIAATTYQPACSPTRDTVIIPWSLLSPPTRSTQPAPPPHPTPCPHACHRAQDKPQAAAALTTSLTPYEHPSPAPPAPPCPHACHRAQDKPQAAAALNSTTATVTTGSTRAGTVSVCIPKAHATLAHVGTRVRSHPAATHRPPY